MVQEVVLEHNYKSFIAGKRVAFIGPAPNLKGLGMGEFIDSFDIVIRTNHFIELVKKHEISRDYGKKTTILYCNRQYYREMRPLPFKEWASRGLDWICAKHMKPSDRKIARQWFKYRTVAPTIQSYLKTCPSMLMGVVAMVETAECEPKEFYVDGIDFNISRKKVFEYDNYREYVDGYLPERIRNQGNVINVGKMEDGHNVKDNTQIIHHLWKSGKVTFPDRLVNLLNGIMSGEIVQE